MKGHGNYVERKRVDRKEYTKKPGAKFDGNKFEGSRSEGNRPQGGKFEGSRSEGNRPQGGKFEGSRSEGSRSEGKKFEGSKFEGNRPQGGKFEGSRSEGNRPQGGKFEGSRSEGNRPQGGKFEGSRSEGNKPQGGKFEGSKSEGNRPLGGKFEGSRSEGNRPQGGKFRGDRDRYQGDKGPGRFQGDRNQKGEAEGADFDKSNRKSFEGEFEMDADRLEGRNSILEALKAGRTINKIIVAKGEKEGSIKQIIGMAKEKGIIIQEFERSRIDALAVTRAHQGVLAYVSPKDYVEVDDILKIAEASGNPPFILVLDEITDPQNLGSLLRTADAAGVHGVIIPKRRAAALNASVSKASAGAVEYVPVARVTNIGQTLEQLKKNNIWVVGTDSSGKQAFYEGDLKGPIALVIGSEGEGMGRLVLEKCDFVVNIPMLGNISSLNASAAGAIVMYEILKQRSR